MRTWHARWALTEDGWLSSANVSIAADGSIASIEAGAPPADAAAADLLLPGMPDAHCHAFQRGIAGLTERCQRYVALELEYPMATSATP